MKFFKNLKLSRKISLLSVSTFIFLIIIGATSIVQISDVNSKLMELNNSRLAPIVILDKLKGEVEYIRSQGNAFMGIDDEETKSTLIEDINSHGALLDEGLSQYKDNAEFKTLLENYNAFVVAKDAFIQFEESRNTSTPSPDATVTEGTPSTDGAIVHGGRPEEMTNFDTARANLIASFDEIISHHVSEASKTYDKSRVMYRNTIIALITLVLISLIISFLLSLITIRGIVAPLRKVTSKLKEISENNGDLTQRIGYQSKDEIGQLSNSFDLFMDKLQGLIKEVALSANTISESSLQLAEGTTVTTIALEDISNTITEIAASTSQGASTVEEATATLSEATKFSEATASASKNTTYTSRKVREAADDGASKISEVVSSITDIADSSKEVSSIIKDLDASSKKIGDIIEIITSISEQTNLLALNAAIEAARAGEAGRGFNVVADEIRKLADESNNAAREIFGLVKENQLKSGSAVASVNDVEEKVSLGVNKASEVGESIQNIIQNINLIVTEIEEIDDANEHQAESTKEIEKTIITVATTSNEIAAGTENISASIEEQLATMTEIERTTENLSTMARKLSEITSGFTV